MSFDHSSANNFFGFDSDYRFPLVCIDNPLVYVFKAQESTAIGNQDEEWS